MAGKCVGGNSTDCMSRAFGVCVGNFHFCYCCSCEEAIMTRKDIFVQLNALRIRN